MAIGAQVSDKDSKLILTVATNDKHVLAYIRNHLHRVWTSLKDVANVFQKYNFRSTSPILDSPADAIAKVDGFVQLLWEYSLERYKHCLHKPLRSIPQRTRFDEFIEARYLDPKNPQGGKTKQFSDILRSMESIDKSLQSGNSDYTVLYACFIQINDRVKNVLRDHRHTCAPRVIQYLNKISSFPAAVHALLVFAAFPQLRSCFLLNKILEVRYIFTKSQVVTLPEQPVWQEVARAALHNYKLTLIPRDPTPGTFKRPKRKQNRASANTKVPIHCELAIALVFLSEKDPPASTFANIGTSRLSCFACWKFLFCIRKKKSENQIEPCFYTKGTNGKACFPWKYPGQEQLNLQG